MRSTRSEVLSLVTALVLPAAVFCSLPYTFSTESKEEKHSSSGGFASFVTLTSRQEEQIMKRAKMTRVSDSSRNERKLDLILSVLPDDAPQPLLKASEIAPVRKLEVSPFRFGPYAPTCAASRPAVLRSEPEKAEAAFSREEMRKID